ncbi:hypothetical protein [Streptomyces sp. CC53]|uniref:hypothetical protein n=1 Tax=Streptomyces sp. CC53 TaxID=1906740 RepID=UPI0015A69879|nr:hypothetical protein [Streptomyces sp. CC53]
MRSRLWYSNRTHAAVVGCSLLFVTFGMTPPAHAADPTGCTRSSLDAGGVRVTCAAGVPAGQSVEGTDFTDIIEITGTVAGSIVSRGGDDRITVTAAPGGTRPGRGGAPGPAGVTGAIDACEGNDTVTITGGRGGDAPPVQSGANQLVAPGGLGGDALTGTIRTGTGKDTVTLTGGQGGAGRAAGTSGGVALVATDGGGGGDGTSGGAVIDIGSGDLTDFLRITGGKGGPAGPGRTSSLDPAAGGGGGTAVAALNLLGTHTGTRPDVLLQGGTGGQRSSAPNSLGGNGGPGVQTFDGTSVPGINVTIAGGSDAPGAGANRFANVGIRARFTASMGPDTVSVTGGTIANGSTAYAAGVFAALRSLAGDDTLTVFGNRGLVDCGSGNDAYNYLSPRGVNSDCETITNLGRS